MQFGALTAHADVAQVVLYAFWVFFAGLIFYIRREDRREGYPLESEVTGKPGNSGLIWIPEPKTFLLHDGTKVLAPRRETDRRVLKAEPAEPWAGSPLRPTGNPMLDGVGPAAYALRADKPEMTHEGLPKIVPLRAAPDYAVDEHDRDPRGFVVIGADGEVAGKVGELWIDRAEMMIRYIEVHIPRTATGKWWVLVPVPLVDFDTRNRCVRIDAVLAAHFADAPITRGTDEITMLEEEMISAYFASGYMYATPGRVGPLL